MRFRFFFYTIFFDVETMKYETCMFVAINAKLIYVILCIYVYKDLM